MVWYRLRTKPIWLSWTIVGAGTVGLCEYLQDWPTVGVQAFMAIGAVKLIGWIMTAIGLRRAVDRNGGKG